MYPKAADDSVWADVGSFDSEGGATMLSGIGCRVDSVTVDGGKIIKVMLTKIITGSAIIRPALHYGMLSDKEQPRTYSVDTLSIISIMEYPSALPEDLESHIAQVTITGQVLEGLVIINSKAW